MNVFVIRHKNSGLYMPEYKGGKGYSYWLYDDEVNNQKKTPRLLESRKQAEKVIVEWAKGILVWEDVKVRLPNEAVPDWAAFEFHDPKRVIKPLGRTKDMLEVVEIELKEIV